MKFLNVAAACAVLAGCSTAAPGNPAQQADDTACTAQADALYQAQTPDLQARTGQDGLLFSATPNHVFDAEQIGALHQRDSALSQCEQNGDSSTPNMLGAPAVTPHIIGNP